MSDWITPHARGQVSHRFDTRFYAVEAPAAAEAITDDREVFEATWVTPRRALDLADRGDWVLEFPTSWHLTALDGFAEPGEVLDHFRQEAGTEPVRPRVDFHDDGTFDILLPGDEGYEAAQP